MASTRTRRPAPRHADRTDWAPLLAATPALVQFMGAVTLLLYAAMHWPAPLVFAATALAIGAMCLTFRALALDEPLPSEGET